MASSSGPPEEGAKSTAASKSGKKPSDFRLGKILGSGSFSDVYRAQEISTGRIFAIKLISKKPRSVRDQKNHVNGIFMEKEVLRRCNHPFIVNLHYTFQDEERLYFVIDYCARGELLSYLKALTCFGVRCTQFYMAEVFSGLEYLHSKGIVHRDMKPENILLDSNMHIKLVDFGSAILVQDCDRVQPVSFTGTAQYVPPEMLNASQLGVPGFTHTYLMDFWSFGCIIYQCISGMYPFRLSYSGAHEYAYFQKILQLDYDFQQGFDECAKSLVKSLLILDPRQRLGSPELGGHAAIKTHPFFAAISWDTLPTCTPPELVPNLPETVDDEIWENIQTGYRHELSVDLAVLESNAKDSIIKEQAKCNLYHRFVNGALILKQGIIKKRRGLSAKRRMFLLTEGPRLIYVDPQKMEKKGEVPWSNELKLERKHERLFLIITPGRTYILECDSSGECTAWMERLAQVKFTYFREDAVPLPGAGDESTASTENASPFSKVALNNDSSPQNKSHPT